MIPTVLPARLRGRAQVLGGQRDQAAERALHERHHRLRVPAGGDQAGDVAAVGEPELGAAGVDQLQRVGGRAGRDHAQVDALLTVVPGGQRPVDPRVDGVGDEVEDQRRLGRVRRRGAG